MLLNQIQDGVVITMLLNLITNKILAGEVIIVLKLTISLMELLQMTIKDGEQVLLIMIINNNLDGVEQLNRLNNHNKILGEAIIIKQQILLLKILGEEIIINQL